MTPLTNIRKPSAPISLALGTIYAPDWLHQRCWPKRPTNAFLDGGFKFGDRCFHVMPESQESNAKSVRQCIEDKLPRCLTIPHRSTSKFSLEINPKALGVGTQDHWTQDLAVDAFVQTIRHDFELTKEQIRVQRRVEVLRHV